MLQFLLIFVLCVGAFAQVPEKGKCPKVKIQQHFEIDEYMGRWYEAGGYFAANETGGKCTTANYSKNSDGSIHIINTQIKISTGDEVKIEGTSKLVDKSGDAKFSVTFPALPIHGEILRSILKTDYKSYSVAWTCVQDGDIHYDNAWILTRERHAPADVLEEALKVFDENHLDRTLFIPVNQENCDHKPDE